jgi:hypothetical protein
MRMLVEIDYDTWEVVRAAADRHYRNPRQQLKFILDRALRVSPKSPLLCRNPVAERRRHLGGFESLEHEVHSTDP